MYWRSHGLRQMDKGDAAFEKKKINMKSTNSEISDVREQHRFDVEALKNYIHKNINDVSGELTVHQFSHGQSNPTFLLNDNNKKYVMRKKPPGKLLPSAHAVEREYRIITALRDTGVPVPETFAFCENESIVGTAFYIMDYVEGRVFRSPFAHEAAGAGERAAIYDSMNDTLARIHLVDWEAKELSDFGKPGNYMARQVGRWTKQYHASQTDRIESMDNLINWLQDNIPKDDNTSIVHGDYRLENMIIHPTEPRVAAVLDWEISTLGHPHADLAYNCMTYHIPEFGNIKMSLMGVNLKELGIPGEEEYLASYCRRTGMQGIPNWEFFLAFSIFRLAAIVQGVYKRGLDGNASSENAMSYGEFTRFLAHNGWKIVK